MAKREVTSFWKVGQKYFIMTVTMFYTGELAEIGDDELVLKDVAWIACTKRLSETLAKGEFDEIEPYMEGDLLLVNRQAVVSACVWRHELPKKQKS